MMLHRSLFRVVRVFASLPSWNILLYNAMKLICSLLLLLLIVVSDSLAQYVGASRRTLQFRLYGRNARPITPEDTSEYSIHHEFPDDSAWRSHEYVRVAAVALLGNTFSVSIVPLWH